LKFKFDRIYSNIVTTEEYIWAPSSRVFSGHNGVDASISDANIDKDYLKEGNSDSDEI
jgi:hypothetical protein